MCLAADIGVDVAVVGRLRNLAGTHTRDDAAILGDDLSAKEDHVDTRLKAGHGKENRGQADGGGRDAVGLELLDDAVALLGVLLIPDVYDLESAGDLLLGSLEDAQHCSRRAVREDRATWEDETPALLSDTVAGIDGTLGEQLAILDEVLAHGIEVAVLLLKHLAGEPQEEVCSRQERHGVADGGLEALRGVVEDLNRLVGCGGGNRVEESDERLDRYDGLGQVGVVGEELVVRRDDVEAGAIVAGGRAYGQASGRRC